MVLTKKDRRILNASVTQKNNLANMINNRRKTEILTRRANGCWWIVEWFKQDLYYNNLRRSR